MKSCFQQTNRKGKKSITLINFGVCRKVIWLPPTAKALSFEEKWKLLNRALKQGFWTNYFMKLIQLKLMLRGGERLVESRKRWFIIKL